MGCDGCRCGEFSTPETREAFEKVLEQHGEAFNPLADSDKDDA